MTSAERAEKIVNSGFHSGEEWKILIANQIEEVEREALEMKVHSLAKECQAWYERGQADQISENAFQFGKVEGFALAREQAVELAEYHSGPSIQLAEKIRALKEKV